MTSNFVRISFACAMALSLSFACGKKEKEGTQGGECFPNWTCNPGLVCDRGTCVPIDGGNTTATGDGDTSEALAEALEECFDCGSDQCVAESDACDAEGGCKEALECSLSCAGDASCGSKCDVSGLTQAGIAAMTNYTTCTTQKCADTCVNAILDIVSDVGGDGDGDVGGDGDGDGDTTGSLDDALEACFSCGGDECSTESSACSSASGCQEALQCSLSCAGDATCASSCDVSGLTQEGIYAFTDYAACVSTSCEAECVDAIIDAAGGGDGDSTTATSGDGDGDSTTATGDGDGDTGDTCVSGDERYSCVESAPEVCVDGAWVQESCDACALVSPSDTCAKISGIAFRKLTDEDVESFTPSVWALTQSTTSVTASWTFDYSGYPQYGVIQYKFSAPIEPSTISITATGESIVSFESDDGTSGCEYYLSGTTPVQNVQDYWDGCWGSTTASRTVINVRSEQVYEGTVAVSLTGIGL